MPKVSIHIVTWNSMRFLPDALQSIAQQTFRDFQVIVVDNASTDGVTDFLRAQYPEVIVLRNGKNVGFARAHNQGIELARSLWVRQGGVPAEQFVLVTNPDILLTPTYLETIMPQTALHPDGGSFGGTLLKVFEKRDGELVEPVRSTMIDTTGLKVFKNGRMVERGAGETAGTNYQTSEEVFGFSGALGLYRLSALEDIRYENEYFDDRFFAYKEDVDLAWRLRWRGWKAWFVPEALAYHYRGAFGSEKRSFRQAWKERRVKSSLVNRLSFRNHFWVLLKNLDMGTFFRYAPWLFLYEFLKDVYVIVFERGTLRAAGESLAGIPEMLRKRAHTMRGRKVSPAQLRRWFV